jgi:hypothetical protein
MPLDLKHSYLQINFNEVQRHLIQGICFTVTHLKQQCFKILHPTLCVLCSRNILCVGYMWLLVSDSDIRITSVLCSEGLLCDNN